METEYRVKMAVFEGPLELLLHLIEKRKLLINDVSLAAVADDYMEYVKNSEKFPVGEVANFILIASALILIKSRSLLPALQLTEEEEGSIEDLQRRLREYKRIKELSVHVKERFGRNIMFARSQSAYMEPVFSPDESMSVANIFSAMKGVLKKLPQKEIPLPKIIVRKVVSLQEMIERLAERMQSSLAVSFQEFSGMGRKEKISVVVGFLAMLELVKLGIIAVRQEENFKSIEMESREVPES
ncbi:MAG: segregation/condensation protein A [Patescibacteria group bacterium]|nr:MAG: segregation/condensation protein A [Patescibacteria group bacterium]